MNIDPSRGITIDEANIKLKEIYKDIEIISEKLRSLNYSAKNPTTIPTNSQIRDEVNILFTKLSLVASLIIPMDIKHLNSVNFEGDFLHPVNQRRQLGHHLSQLRSLIEISPDIKSQGVFQRTYTDEVLSNLRMLDQGEVPDLFRPEPRKAGQRHNSWSMAERKLAALAWDQRLRAAGYSAGESQGMIVDGFGQPWSTIFGWKRQCARVLGNEAVEEELRLSREAGQENPQSEDDLRFWIRVDGQAFNKQCSKWDTPLVKEWIEKSLKDGRQNSNG